MYKIVLCSWKQCGRSFCKNTSKFFPPVALPSVADVHVADAVSVGLLIQEIKHVLDGQRQRRAPAHRAEQGLEQVVHKLLQRALQETSTQ